MAVNKCAWRGKKLRGGLVDGYAHDRMNDSPKRDVEIFNKALQLAVGERNAYLEKACGSDLGLLKKVEKLLKAHDLVGDFMEQSPQNGAAQARLEISVGANWRGWLWRGFYGGTDGAASSPGCLKNH